MLVLIMVPVMCLVCLACCTACCAACSARAACPASCVPCATTEVAKFLVLSASLPPLVITGETPSRWTGLQLLRRAIVP